MILNVAVGGGWPGNPDSTTTLPQTMVVDYVRVYALPPATPTSVTAAATGPTAVTVTWQKPDATDAVPVTNYRVERADDAAFTQNVATFSAGPGMAG